MFPVPQYCLCSPVPLKIWPLALFPGNKCPCSPVPQNPWEGLISNNLIHHRRQDLEVFWEESLWVEVKINKQPYLLGTFYSPRPQDHNLFDALDRNMEKAMEISENIIILGDLNEDLLNANFRNLRDILLTNSLQNIIAEPTRGSRSFGPNYRS